MSTATRPSGFPGWASGASGWIAEPTALVKALGWQPSQAPPSSYQNWLHALTYGWLKYLDETRTGDFGDGSDGDIMLMPTGATGGTVSWATGPTWTPLLASPGVYATGYSTAQITLPNASGGSGAAFIMTRDAFLNTLVVPSGVELQTNGFRLHVKDTLTATGFVTANGLGFYGGAAGTSGTPPGLGGSRGSIGGGAMGGYGGLNIASLATGTSGAVATGSYGGNGGSAGVGGGGGTAYSPSGVAGSAHIQGGQLLGHLAGNGQLLAFNGGAGGGGGRGSGNSGWGGAGGGGGGVLAIAARNIVVAGSTCLQAAGGWGGGAFTLGDGGGGGGGGVMVLVYADKHGTTFSTALNTPGGMAGGGYGNGLKGATGSNGSVFEMQR